MNLKRFFGRLEISIFPEVYEPREDSFLLAKAVDMKKGATVLDLGCGSGIQGINAASEGASQVLCADINKQALKCAEFNAQNLGFSETIETRETNLFKEIPESFDCIIFNPPYVPSETVKHLDTDGGKRGRETLNRFLIEFGGHLNKKGVCFFLQSSLNDEEITKKLLERQGFETEVTAREKLFFEELIVFKCFNA